MCVCASPGAECLKRALLPRGLLLMPSSVSTMSFIWEAKISMKNRLEVDDFWREKLCEFIQGIPFFLGFFSASVLGIFALYVRQMFDLKPTVWLIEGGNLEKSWLLPWGPATIIKSLRETLRDAIF